MLNEYDDKRGGKYKDKHDYEDKPYDKPSYEYKKQYDYGPDYIDGKYGYEYYKTAGIIGYDPSK